MITLIYGFPRTQIKFAQNFSWTFLSKHHHHHDILLFFFFSQSSVQDEQIIEQPVDLTTLTKRSSPFFIDIIWITKHWQNIKTFRQHTNMKQELSLGTWVGTLWKVAWISLSCVTYVSWVDMHELCELCWIAWVAWVALYTVSWEGMKIRKATQIHKLYWGVLFTRHRCTFYNHHNHNCHHHHDQHDHHDHHNQIHGLCGGVYFARERWTLFPLLLIPACPLSTV